MSQYMLVFSPTGGTRRVADIMAEAMGGQWQVMDLCYAAEPAALGADDVCLVAVPSYGGRVPAVAVERIRAVTGNGTKAILVCVYGNREWDDTLTELQDVLEDKGFTCAAAVAAVAEHSIFRQYAAGRPDEADAAELAVFARQIQKKLVAGHFEPLELPGSHGTYREFGGTPFKPEGNQNCVGCALCARECPVGAISHAEPHKTDMDRCISCMRCVVLCRQHARDLNKVVMEDVGARMAKALSGRKENHLFL